MISTYKYKNTTWIDVESPTADEIKSLMQKYAVHPLVAEELLRPTIKSKVDVHKNFIYMILHFPIFEHQRKMSMSCEIDFVIGKNFVITVHYRQIVPLYEIAKNLETNTILKDGNFTKNGGVLTFYIVRQLYDFAARQLDHIQLKINKIEENIFKGKEKEMVEAISYIRCDIIDFQRTIHAHKSVLYSLEPAGANLFGKDFLHYVNNMVGEFAKIKNHLAVIKETIISLQDTNDSLLTDKANDTMKTLSILAFLTFPLMLVAALFSMDTVHTPIVGIRGDFWVIFAIMMAGVASMIIIFKRKKWL